MVVHVYLPLSTCQVIFMHPVHNFAIVVYDPSSLGAAAYASVKAATLAPCELEVLECSASG